MTYADMLKFCGVHDETRPQIQTPWHANGKYYATDGRIGIALDAKPDGWVDVNAGVRPNLQLIIDGVTDKVKPPRPVWERPHAPEFKTCPWCAKSRKITCPHCRCEITECKECKGTGKIEIGIIVRCFGSLFQNHYLALVASLPRGHVCEGLDDLGPIRFEFDGGCGVLMPIRHDNKGDSIRDALGGAK